MANYTADQMIGRTLVATKDVVAYSGYPYSAKTKTLKSGEVIGVVWSWIKDPKNSGNVDWGFNEKYGDAHFWVKHDPSALKLHSAETVETVEEKKKRLEEERKKEEMGAIPYYLERYGKPILGLAALGLAIKGYSVYQSGKRK